ncbi:MAG: hypothetical protein ACPGOY_06560 [Rhodospirillaceae bacterium]
MPRTSVLRSTVAAFGLSLLASPLAAPAMAEDLDFMLINSSSSDIVAFYVSESGNNQWGENLIAGGILAADYEVGVVIADGLDVCAYDLRADFADGGVWEDYDLDFCDMGSYTFTD